jgi:hypothetical protein
MRHFHWTHICLLGGLALTSVATNAHADAWNKKTYVTISQSIEVPGAILAPGKYVFKLMDSASNRHIVQILNADENHVYTTNLAFAKERMEPADKTILTFYEMPGGGPEPVRAWFYPGDTIGQEFAYPGKRATEISQAVGQKVPVLAASNTAPMETPAPEAQPTPAPVPDNSADRVVETPSEAAEPTPTPAPVTPEAVEPPAEQPAEPAAVQEPAQPAQSAPTEPQMPHTAGNTAAMGLAGISLLGIAALIRKSVQRAGSRS